MADDSSNTSTTASDSQNTSGGDGKNTQDSQTGADTQAAVTSTEGKQQQQQSQQAQQQQAKSDDDAGDKSSGLSQDQVNKIVAKRVDKAVRQALIKRGIDPDDKDTSSGTRPTVDTVTKERDDLASRLRTLEARDQLESFITDKRNNVQVRNVRGLFKYIKDDLEYDDEGAVTNFKDVLAAAKSEASEFFGAQAHSIDAGKGSQQNGGGDMNTLIRHMAGR